MALTLDKHLWITHSIIISHGELVLLLMTQFPRKTARTITRKHLMSLPSQICSVMTMKSPLDLPFSRTAKRLIGSWTLNSKKTIKVLIRVSFTIQWASSTLYTTIQNILKEGNNNNSLGLKFMRTLSSLMRILTQMSCHQSAAIKATSSKSLVSKTTLPTKPP